VKFIRGSSKSKLQLIKGLPLLLFAALGGFLLVLFGLDGLFRSFLLLPPVGLLFFLSQI